ncbi:hypothetical protein X895_5738 [Burkholderia pseudomallei MSHR4503]|nr:hypothetical protein X895_5738 [Burkholderia pseudomallei MSHR4503]
MRLERRALRQSAVGSRQSAVGSRQSAVGSRQSAVGSRQSAVGSRQSAVIVRCCRPSVRAAIDAASFSHRVTRFPQLLVQAFAAYRRITHAHSSAAASGTPAARSRGQIGRSMPAERWVRAASVSLPFLNRTTLFRNRNAFDIFAFAPPVGAPSFDTRLSRYPCSLFRSSFRARPLRRAERHVAKREHAIGGLAGNPTFPADFERLIDDLIFFIH